MCHENQRHLSFNEMSLQAIEATPKHGHPALPADLRRTEMTAASLALRRSISFQRKQAPIAPPYRRLHSKTFDGLRRSTRVIARASVAAGICVLSLVSDIPREHRLYRESYTRAAAFVAPVEGRQSSKVPADPLPLVPRIEFDAFRSAAAVATIKQQRALDQERERADALARKLASLQAELEASRTVDSEEAVQAAAALIAQMRALDQERDRADALARELASVRNALEAANRQIANLNAPVATTVPALYSRKSALDSLQERIAELSSTTIAGKRLMPKRVSGNGTTARLEHSTASELLHPLVLTAREVTSDLAPKVAVGTDRPASASGAFRSPKHRLRMHRSGKPILATLRRCLNVPTHELPSCRLRPATTRTYRNHDARRLLASTRQRSGSQRRNDDQLVEIDPSKGATQ
jgi:hypothetical protein